MFHGVPRSVILASLLGLIPILLGLLSTFNIGLNVSVREELIRLAIIYSGFILSFMSGCIFFVSSIEREKEYYLWLSIFPVLLAILSIIIPIMKPFVLALGFLVILEIERKLHKLRSLPKWWLNFRFPMTFLVVLLLVLLGFQT